MQYVAEAGQAAHDHLPSPEELTTPEGRAKFQQARYEQWLKEQRRELKAGEAGKVLDELARLQRVMQEQHFVSAVETISKKLSYLRERRAMLGYASFQAQGYPIGSGSVESANKLVVQSRMKGAGMRWAPGHVNAMLAVRNLACNDRWQAGWSAIRQRWQQDQHSKRAVRAQLASSQDGPAPAPLAQRRSSAAGDHEQTPRKGEPTTQPTAAGVATVKRTQGQPTRPATTHPWRKPFLRRRSA
jgi:hypothetical protein